MKTKITILVSMAGFVLFIAAGLVYSARINGAQGQVGAGTVKLPAVNMDGSMPLMDALKNRSSQREFSDKPLKMQILGDMLWAANGVNRENGMRTAPSAHNCQEIDIYVVTPERVWLYDAQDHALIPTVEGDLRSLTGYQDFAGRAPVNLVFVADYSRMDDDNKMKFFYTAADTGFVSQNVYLYCASKGLATVVRGWVDKDALARAMKLKPHQKITLAQTVGYPKEKAGDENPSSNENPSSDADPSSPGTDRKYRDGVYQAQSSGYQGPVAVKVKIDQGRIVDIKVTKSNESRPGGAYKKIPERVLQNQSVDNVDAVTGATYTSDVLLKAIGAALEKAAE